jgi:hypothetical protein
VINNQIGFIKDLAAGEVFFAAVTAKKLR